jgi:mycofactocin precursor
MEDQERQERDEQGVHNDEQDDSIFSTHEIKIEELAIDGICGVY